jgi:hypothetical protein
MQVRPATLDDTRDIVTLFTATIPKWQRINAQGHVEDVPYDGLTIYEQWLHGGAWMSLETAVIWLNHILSGYGRAYIIEIDGDIVGYAEAFFNDEVQPMGKHLYVSQMQLQDTCADDMHQALADAIMDDARTVGKLSVSYAEYDSAQARYYRQYFGTNEAMRLSRYTMSAQTGQSFYKASEYHNADPKQIQGWEMSIGRTTSPRSLWEREWAQHWQAIPQITQHTKHRLSINAAGHEAIVCYHQQLYNTRAADVYCWSPKKLSSQLIVAIRDWGHRAGYRSLNITLPPESAILMPAEATQDPHQQIIATVTV